MVDLQWEGTFGYGDICGMITNALWHRRVLQREVYVNCVWYDDRSWCPPNRKYHPDDAETIMERVDLIKQQFIHHEDVNIEHLFFNHVGPKNGRRLQFMNRMFPTSWIGTMSNTTIHPTDGDYIVLWTPFLNVDKPAALFPTAFKDPLSLVDGEWDKLYKMLDGHKVIEINYREPVNDVFNKIAGAKLCIGYEGIGQVISKNFWKPIITFSGTESTSLANSGPWALVTEKITDEFNNLDNIIKQQIPQIANAKQKFHEKMTKTI